MDQLTAVATVVGAVASLLAGLAAALRHPTQPGNWLKGALVTVSVAVLTGLAYLTLVAFGVGPFKSRDIAFTDGFGSTGCLTTLEGDATVPAGEDAWILLLDDESGEFYIQGPKGGPVVSGEEDRQWRFEMIVSDQFYDGASYSVLGLIVPFGESARLQAQPEGAPLPAEALPTTILDSTRERINLDSTANCDAPSP